MFRLKNHIGILTCQKMPLWDFSSLKLDMESIKFLNMKLMLAGMQLIKIQTVNRVLTGFHNIITENRGLAPHGPVNNIKMDYAQRRSFVLPNEDDYSHRA